MQDALRPNLTDSTDQARTELWHGGEQSWSASVVALAKAQGALSHPQLQRGRTLAPARYNHHTIPGARQRSTGLPSGPSSGMGFQRVTAGLMDSSQYQLRLGT